MLKTTNHLRIYSQSKKRIIIDGMVLGQKREIKRQRQKLSNLELWSLLTTNRKFYMGFSKKPFLNP